MARFFNIDLSKEDTPSMLQAGWWHPRTKSFSEIAIPEYVRECVNNNQCVDYTLLADSLGRLN